MNARVNTYPVVFLRQGGEAEEDYTGEPYRTQVRNPVYASEVRRPGCAHA